MKRLLVTGSTGFIGRNVLPSLKHDFVVYSPKREDLNLFSFSEIRSFLIENNIDEILHLANPNPVKNSSDSEEKMLEDSLRIFLNFYENQNLVERIVYLGSGAEYDKTQDISMVKEESCFERIPKDTYGLSKYLMNRLADVSKNVINLCLFGCYGPTDHPSKFITHCIDCIKNKEPITIKQDCRFDYIQVDDLARIIKWALLNKPKHHMYNTCSGKPILLSEIALEVINQMGAKNQVIIAKEGMNNEYTASSCRLESESGLQALISMPQGIAIQINSEMKNEN